MTRSPETLRDVARHRLARKRRFQTHLLFHVVGLLVLAGVWAATEYQNAGGWPTGFRTGRQNHDWDPWIIYPVIAAFVFLAIHAWHTFARRPMSGVEIRREMERLSRA